MPPSYLPAHELAFFLRNPMANDYAKFCHRFRGYLPVVIDVETAGFDCQKDALLEMAAVMLKIDSKGMISRDETIAFHVMPFEGAHLDEAALEFTGIDPYHPFRFAVDEKKALTETFYTINQALKKNNCQKAILVGHNSHFDLSFIKAAAHRIGYHRIPFHPFSTLDTVSLSALALGQTVLAKAIEAAKIEFNHNEAHSAIYDAEKTADLFCFIVNWWQRLGGWNAMFNKPAP